MILNYLSNPTAHVVTLNLYKDVVTCTKRNDIIILV